MTVMERIVIVWAGWTGAPGYTTFYATPGQAGNVRNALSTWASAISAQVPVGVNLTTPASGDLIDDSDGKISGSWSSGAGGTFGGASGGGFHAASGAYITWTTAAVVTGRTGKSRRLRARSFLVPLGNGSGDTDGTLTGATRSAIQTASTSLLTTVGANMLAWHRPNNGPKPGTGTNGSSSPITGFVVPDRVGVLRSRRA